MTEVTWPNVVEVGLKLGKSNSGWFSTLMNSPWSVNRTCSLMRTSLLTDPFRLQYQAPVI